MPYDLSRAHPNNPFRQPTYVPPEEIYTDPAYPMHGSRWLGFGPGPTKVDTQVVHYPGSRLSALQLSTKADDVKARLRASNQSSWKSRGYALYYGFDLPTDGSLYGIRAFNWRNAANADDDPSDGNENDWSFAVHTILQKLNDDPKSNVTVEPTWDQLETLRWLRWEAREYAIEATGNVNFELKLLPHQAIKPTGCPGDKMVAAINRGALDIPPRTSTKPDPIPGGDLMITVFKPKEGADLKGEVIAQFIGMADVNGNVLGDLYWINDAKAIAVRDAHLAAGAVEDDGDCTKGRFRNCRLKGPIPVGATYQWSADDFWQVDS